MQSSSSTVDQYLSELPDDRRDAIEAVRAVILKNLPSGVTEGMSYGMIGYAVPHSIYPAGYHCDPKQPLPFASLASQKNYMALYLMNLYTAQDQECFASAWAKSGKRLDMGKSCVRFKKLDDLALDVVGKAIARWTVAQHIANYETARDAPRARPTKKKAATKSGKKVVTNTGGKKTATKPAKKRGSKAGSKR
jgi:hypothetical protein